MPYAQQTDISPRRLTAAQLVQLTDDANLGQVNAAIVADVLADASGIIENYCRQRYALPLQQTPELTTLCVDIAVYKLYSRRPGKMAVEVRQTYEDAMSLLKDIATKKASLDQPVTPTVEQSPSASLLVSGKPRIFGNSNLEGFVGRQTQSNSSRFSNS